MKKAVFAGGCFWCIESDFKKLEGVIDAVSGYIGDTKESANYEAVCSGLTNHREAVFVTYDEIIVSYQALIDYFWTCIDPTNPYGQFADLGHQYTTAIYYQNESEKRIAEDMKKALNDAKKFKDEIATDILPLTDFYEAEEYHQSYSKKSPDHYERYRIGSGRTGFIIKTWGDKK